MLVGSLNALWFCSKVRIDKLEGFFSGGGGGEMLARKS